MKIYLLLNFVGRAVGWGVLFGAIVGFLYVFLITGFSISLILIFGIIVGLIFGIILGGVNGILLWIITICFHSLFTSQRRYRFVALLSMFIVTFFLSLILVSELLNFYSVTGRVDTIVVLIPAIFAAFTSGYASLHISDWYLEQQKAS